MGIQHITEPNKRNPIYFWNNLYNSNLVRNRIFEDWSRSFGNSLEKQQQIKASETLMYRMKDFKQDSVFCYRHKIPQNAYLLEIHQHPLLYTHYTKEYFLFAIDYEHRISLKELLENDVIERNIMIRIGGYFLPKLEIVEMPHATYLVLIPDVTVSSSILNELLAKNAMIDITITPNTDIFRMTGTITNIFRSGTANIPLSKVTLSRTHFDCNATTDYQLYFIAHYSTSDIMIQTPGKLVSTESDTYFALDPKFRQYFIKSCMTNNVPLDIQSQMNPMEDTPVAASGSVSKVSFEVYAIQDVIPGIKSIETVPEDKLLRTAIPYKDNPIAANHIRVYRFNSERMVIGEIIPTTITQSHPNIYKIDLRHMSPREECYIYAMELPYSRVMTHFDYILDSYTSYDWDVYFDAVAFGNELLPFTSYHPLDAFTYDYSDYMAHDFYLDLRGYEIKKLDDIYFSAPRYFNAYLNRQYQYVKLQDKESLTTMQATVFKNRKEASNRFYNTNDDQAVVFMKPFNYIQYMSANNIDQYVELYVDGKRTFVTFQEIYCHNLYYFYDGDGLDHKEVSIVVCKWPRSNPIEIEFTFNGKDECIEFPESDKMGDITIGDLIYIDKITGNYIPSSDIQYQLSVGESEIQAPHIENATMPGFTETSYFLTHQIEYYSTVLGEKFRLDENHVLVEPPITTNPDGEEVLYDYTSSKKVIDSSNLEISTNEEKHVDRDIIVTNTNNGLSGIIRDMTEDMDKKLGFTLFTQDPDPSRFRCYHNGRLLRDTEYTYEKPTTYRNTIWLDFSSFTDGEIIVDYIPYREEKVLDKNLDQSDGFQYIASTLDPTYTNQGILLDLASIEGVDYPACASMVKVWVDGYYILPEKIHNTPALGIVFVETDAMLHPLEHRVTVYLDKIDEDCFEYATLLEKDPMRTYILGSDSTAYLASNFIRDCVEHSY